jgi:hypothetical protein
MRGTVGIVLNALYFGRYAIFVAQEVNHTVVVLMTTAFVASCDVPVVVTSSELKLRLQQSGVRRTFVQVVTRDSHHATAAW